jgi:hypothetical protein
MSTAEIRGLIGKIWGPPPTVVGEDVEAYELLLQWVIDEWDPETVRQWMLVRQVADRHWELRRYQGFETAIVNGVIVDGMTKGLMAREPAKVFVEVATTLKGTEGLAADTALQALSIPDREIPLDSELGRSWRRICFSAVAGDRNAVKLIEAEFGAGCVGPTAEWGCQLAIPALLLLQRLKNGALASAQVALAELERLKRSPGRKPTLARTKTIERSPTTPTPHAVDTITVHAPRQPSQSEPSR